MKRLLPDTVRDRASKTFGSIAARMIGSGCFWATEDQREIADRCISAALVFETAWRSRREIHDNDLGDDAGNRRPVAIAAGGVYDFEPLEVES